MLLGNRRERKLCRGVRLRGRGVLRFALLVKMGLLGRATEAAFETWRGVNLVSKGKPGVSGCNVDDKWTILNLIFRV